MKRNFKIAIILCLVCLLSVFVFAGCEEDNRPLDEKYGISFTDKTVKYNGADQAIELTLDESVLNGKAYVVEYTVDDKAVSKAQFKDVGEYTVKAKITVDGDETVYELSAKMNITKADLELEIGNVFLEQGRGISTLDSAYTLFADAKFLGDDKLSDLGSLKYKITDGGKNITDTTTLKPVTDINKPYGISIAFDKDPQNYNVKVTNGKFYVLSSADYNLAKDVKEDLALVPTTETIDTYDYYAMRSFLNVADGIIENFPKLSDIQRLMAGTADITSIKSLKKTADNRVNMVYDLKLDSDYAEILFLGANHYANDGRDEDDDNYKDEFEYFGDATDPNYDALKSVEYGDTVAIGVKVKDNYKFQGVTINGVKYYADADDAQEGDAGYSLVVDDDDAPYTGEFYAFGKTTARADTETDGYKQIPSVDSGYGITITNSLLGALTGDDEIEIIANVVSEHEINVINGTNNGTTVMESKNDNSDDAMLGISSLSITSKTGGSLFYATKGTGTSTAAQKANFSDEIKLQIYEKDGYTIDNVEIGDEIIKGSDFKNGLYTFTLEKDHLNDNALKIKVTMVKKYDVTVTLDGKTTSNSNKDGLYDNDKGTLIVSGISAEQRPYILDGQTLKMTVNFSEYVSLKSFIVEYTKADGTTVVPDNLTEEILGSRSKTVEIDLGRGDYNSIDSSKGIKIKVVFADQVNVKVNGSVGELDSTSTSGDEAFKFNKGTFESTYGDVEILSPDGSDEFDILTDGSSYFVEISPNDGYVVKSVKIGGATVLFKNDVTGMNNFYKMINNCVLRIGGSTDKKIPSAYFDDAAGRTEFNDQDNAFLLDLTGRNVDPGDDYEIEVVFMPWYEVNVYSSVSGVFDVDYDKYLMGTYTDGSYTANPTEANASALIKDVKSSSYYVFAMSDNIEFDITPAETAATDDGDALRQDIIDVAIVVGSDSDDARTLKAIKKFAFEVDDVVKGIEPGDRIDIDIDWEYDED